MFERSFPRDLGYDWGFTFGVYIIGYWDARGGARLGELSPAGSVSARTELWGDFPARAGKSGKSWKPVIFHQFSMRNDGNERFS